MPARLMVGVALFLCLIFTHGPKAVAHIVVVKSSSLAPYDIAAAAVQSGIPSGVEVVTLTKDGENYESAVHEIWAAKPDIIIALGAAALDMARQEFSNLPVAFGMIADPDEHTTPSEKLAGITLIASDASVLKAIRSLLPGADDIAVIHDPGRSARQVKQFKRNARSMGIRVQIIGFSDATDVSKGISDAAASCNCFVLYPDPKLLSSRVFASISLQAFKYGLPTVAYSSAFTRMGALMSVEADYGSIGTDLGQMARRMADGADPRELGIHPPSQVTITVNKAVAKQLGIRLSPEVESSAHLIGESP